MDIAVARLHNVYLYLVSTGVLTIPTDTAELQQIRQDIETIQRNDLPAEFEQLGRLFLALLQRDSFTSH